MRVIDDVHSPEAQSLLKAPAFSFDVETDTNLYHWPKSGKRGLSYVADMTEIGFHMGGDWTLVLSAEAKAIEYAATKMERDDEGYIHEVQRAYNALKWKFKTEDEMFIMAMFSREEPVTAIAHNLVFDARQVFSKFNLAVRDNYTLWDTRSLYKLRDAWRPGGVDIEDEDEDDDEEELEDDAPDTGKSRDGAADLTSIYEAYVQKLDGGYKVFISFMKDQRKNFPKIDFKKVSESVVEYIHTAPELQAHADLLDRWQDFQLDKKRKVSDLAATLEAKHNLDRAVLKKLKAPELKALYDQYEGNIDLAPLIADMMRHYVSFDVVAPYEIYLQQVIPPSDYKAYPKLLVEDLEYIKFCAEVASTGMRVDRAHATKKLFDLNEAYRTELLASGLTIADWDRILKRDFLIQYIFWGNRFDAEFKDQKNYAKNVKEAIAAAEAAGEQPVNQYPDDETLAAYQFNLLTKKGQKAFSKRQPITSEHFSFGTKAMKVWLELFPEMPELKNIGRLSKLKGAITFLDMILRESEADGRVHTLLGRFADTGRNTSSAPNVQNIHFDGKDPITDMSGILVSDGPKSVLIELDYSNAENYSAAMISCDDRMAYACCAEDFHSANARSYFGAELFDNASPEDRKKLRGQAKTVTFGKGYGMGAKKLAISLGITFEEAQQLIMLSDQAYPDLTEAKNKSRAFAEKNGWILTWSSRRMKIPKRFNERTFQWEYSAYTNGWNAPNQGGVAEIVVRAINRIRRWLLDNNYKTRILSQVHDSLIINLHLDEYPFVPQKIIQIMGSILDEEIRYKATDDEPAITWNHSTSPAIRWLVDLDNIGNSHKWGYEANREYPLPIDEYVNTWGLHTLTAKEKEEKKAPTWINSFGYGEEALKRELAGELGVELDFPETKEKRESFQWQKLQHALNQLMPLVTPMQVNGHILDFPTAMIALQVQYERGESNEFTVIQEHMGKLQQVVEEYKAWLAN